eukprot:jgi/Bigna1/127549/aug1.4_g2257
MSERKAREGGGKKSAAQSKGVDQDELSNKNSEENKEDDLPGPRPLPQTLTDEIIMEQEQAIVTLNKILCDIALRRSNTSVNSPSTKTKTEHSDLAVLQKQLERCEMELADAERERDYLTKQLQMRGSQVNTPELTREAKQPQPPTEEMLFARFASPGSKSSLLKKRLYRDNPAEASLRGNLRKNIDHKLYKHMCRGKDALYRNGFRDEMALLGASVEPIIVDAIFSSFATSSRRMTCSDFVKMLAASGTAMLEEEKVKKGKEMGKGRDIHLKSDK